MKCDLGALLVLGKVQGLAFRDQRFGFRCFAFRALGCCVKSRLRYACNGSNQKNVLVSRVVSSGWASISTYSFMA